METFLVTWYLDYWLLGFFSVSISIYSLHSRGIHVTSVGPFFFFLEHVLPSWAIYMQVWKIISSYNRIQHAPVLCLMFGGCRSVCHGSGPRLGAVLTSSTWVVPREHI